MASSSRDGGREGESDSDGTRISEVSSAGGRGTRRASPTCRLTCQRRLTGGGVLGSAGDRTLVFRGARGDRALRTDLAHLRGGTVTPATRFHTARARIKSAETLGGASHRGKRAARLVACVGRELLSEPSVQRVDLARQRGDTVGGVDVFVGGRRGGVGGER